MATREEDLDNEVIGLFDNGFLGWLVFFGVIGVGFKEFIKEQFGTRTEGPLNIKEWLWMAFLMVIIIGPNSRNPWTLLATVPICLGLLWLGVTAGDWKDGIKFSRREARKRLYWAPIEHYGIDRFRATCSADDEEHFIVAVIGTDADYTRDELRLIFRFAQEKTERQRARNLPMNLYVIGKDPYHRGEEDRWVRKVSTWNVGSFHSPSLEASLQALSKF